MKFHFLCDYDLDKALLYIQALNKRSFLFTHEKSVLTFGDGAGSGYAKFKTLSQECDENLEMSVTLLKGDGDGSGDYYYGGEGRGDGYTERFSASGGFIYGNSCGSGSGDSSKFT